MAGKNKYYASTSAFEEAFSTLRTNIQFSGIDKKIKIVAVTSVNPSEGKTIISYNLSKSFSNNRNRVLLIDCDMRKPSVANMSGLNNNIGLTNVLVGETNIKDSIVIDSDYEFLDVLLTGPQPPNPSEVLGSNAMKTLIDDAKEEYEYIILDTPPIGIISDALVLANQVDGMVIVVEKDSTKIEDLEKIKERIEQVGGNIIGVVLNGVPAPEKSRYYGYY